MERNKLSCLVDALMFVALGATALIGLLLGFVIPKGEAPPGAKYLWSLHRHDWGAIHLYLSLAFLALLILHIILHWSWIKTTSKRYLGNASVLWAFVVLPLALLFLLWFFYPGSLRRAEQPGGKGPGISEEQSRYGNPRGGGPARE